MNYVTDWTIGHIEIGEVRDYMKLHAGEFYDCGVVNTTKLVEDAAMHFDLYEDDDNYTIPECVFELALEVGEWYETDIQENDNEEDWDDFDE